LTVQLRPNHNPDVKALVRTGVLLGLLFAMSCASLRVHPDEDPVTKSAKIFTRGVLLLPTLGASELMIDYYVARAQLDTYWHELDQCVVGDELTRATANDLYAQREDALLRERANSLVWRTWTGVAFVVSLLGELMFPLSSMR